MCQLSVVIITHNEAKGIAASIESVQKALSHITDAQIILVDSCSTDDTVAIARRYPVTVIELDPDYFLSPAAGRYIGFQHSCGNYVYFMDGDMQLHEDWFTQAVPYLQQHPQLAGIAGQCREQVFNEAGVLVTQRADRFAHENKKASVPSLGGSVLYRRKVLEQTGAFNPYLANEEELELGLRIQTAGYTLERLDIPMNTHDTLYYSNENPSGLTWRGIRRDWQMQRYLALGRILRLLWSHDKCRLFLQRYNKCLFFVLIYILGSLLLVASLLTQQTLWFTAWGATLLLLFAVRLLLKRHLYDTLLYFLDYALCAYGFIHGILLPSAKANTYQPNIKVYKTDDA
ncbi:glycosyltransferase family A protein [Candidatus Venteria ishoeyi]|uniref:glycosyltransferase family 2 protein n=1 Tax=Candidatus Venteria ishoeyi TaxID=1899563 RepID=UPI0025A595B1|nr:glycosyltransferase family A protein [Candidatus Venteria ishoeyi]MDM8548195.1 glycosyltransferase family A protein [Candidatus Venteria ishoeyi]